MDNVLDETAEELAAHALADNDTEDLRLLAVGRELVARTVSASMSSPHINQLLTWGRSSQYRGAGAGPTSAQYGGTSS